MSICFSLLLSLNVVFFLDNYLRRVNPFADEDVPGSQWKDSVSLSKLQFQRLFKFMPKCSQDYKDSGQQRQVMTLDDDRSQIGKGKLAIIIERVKGETVCKITVTYRTKNGLCFLPLKYTTIISL